MSQLFIGLLIIFSISSFAGSKWNVEKLASHLNYKNYSDVAALTDDEKWAVSAYIFTDETDYQDINGFLRGGDSYDLYNQTKESVTKLINNIYSSADKLPRIPEGLIVYRGFKLSWRNDKCFNKGEVFTDKAFISTTLSRKIANHFAFDKDPGKGSFLTLKILTEQKGILITENREEEILLMPQRIITITSSFERNGKCYAKGVLQ